MPERKSPSAGTSTSGRPGGAGARRPATGARGTTGRASGATTSANGAGARPRKNAAPPPRGAGGRPPDRKPGKSIVNQKQTPWGLIAVTVVIVLFAAGIVTAVVATSGGKTKKPAQAAKSTSVSQGGQSVDANDPYRHPELAAAKAIPGVTYRVEANHSHVDGVIQYDASPPIGGNHNALWADCDGNVYTHQIANENAVHMLEHGAVWITYNPKTLSKSGVARLTKYVKGVDRTAMSPYAGLKTPISLQAWGYQLFVSSPTDPRIAQFIKVLKYNPYTTPENADCTNPYFKASDSTLGHPQNIQ